MPNKYTVRHNTWTQVGEFYQSTFFPVFKKGVTWQAWQANKYRGCRTLSHQVVPLDCHFLLTRKLIVRKKKSYLNSPYAASFASPIPTLLERKEDIYKGMEEMFHISKLPWLLPEIGSTRQSSRPQSMKVFTCWVTTPLPWFLLALQLDSAEHQVGACLGVPAEGFLRGT